jgi:plastocyanin
MRLPAVLAILATAGAASAATLTVEVLDDRGAAISEAVVYAIPEGHRSAPPSRGAVLDQKNRAFVPHVLAIQTGTSVKFPNSDNVRHQVYSFSPAKRFQLPLYEGTPAAPVVFDKAGVVTLGCNIHDRMSAYVVVVDTPYFGEAEGGHVALPNLPEGRYTLHVWYAGMRGEAPRQELSLAAGEARDVQFRIDRK